VARHVLAASRVIAFPRRTEGTGVSNPQESVHLIAATIGFLSFALLWLAVIWGLILRNGWMLIRIKHATVYGIHQIVALLGLCLGVVHAAVQLAVPGGTVRIVDEFVPFTNQVDPIGIGVGVIGLELLLAVTGSILIQRILGYSRWRALHALTYAAFMLLVAHLLTSGSEVTGWVWNAVLGSWLSTAVLWLTTTPAMTAVHRGLSTVFARRRGQEIMVNVDSGRCERFGFCEHEAPDVFRLRSDGRLSYNATVPVEQAHTVIRAVEVCPVRAISVNQAPTTVLTPPPAVRLEERVPTNGSRVNGATISGLHRRRGAR
jgi:ferredoxin/DMSO/TMAO reductase YedYZ heme-binding membrane subunit